MSRPPSSTFREPLLHVKESETTSSFDSDSLNPHYSYYDEHNHGIRCGCWTPSRPTTNCPPAKGSEFRARRYGGWIRGHLLWPIWDAAHADDAAAKIDRLAPGPDLISKATADFWHIADTPKHGRRSFEYDAAKTFSPTKPTSHSRSLNIDQFGAANKKIAFPLMMPDPKWTEDPGRSEAEERAGRVLRVGNMANRGPDILSASTPKAMKWKSYLTIQSSTTPFHARKSLALNFDGSALIESTLGAKSIMFRPPYGIDHQPEYARKWRTSLSPGARIPIVGQRIDPDDWTCRTASRFPLKRC